jgi:superfamily I DNA and/or RNA helicase/very-short-patch-repair endonuclease
MNSKKDKYLQIFNYLLEFSKLRSNPVRDILNASAQYPELIWLSDIPKCDIFESITDPNFDEEVDYWLKIKKPKDEPKKPLFVFSNSIVPKWIDLGDIDENNSTPIIIDKIEENNTDLFPDDDIRKILDTYVLEKWPDDYQKYKTKLLDFKTKFEVFNNKNKIYKKFFDIFNKAQHFGEEFELVIGLGLLNFKENENTPLICRHLFTIKVDISFETNLQDSYVQIIPGLENEVQIETDAIIDLQEQFDPNNTVAAEKSAGEFIKAKDIMDNPFDNDFKQAIQIFANRISTEGKFVDEFVKPSKIGNKPVIYYAPAIILRKRNTKSLTAVYQKIIEDITKADTEYDIPLLDDLIDIEKNIDKDINPETKRSFSDEIIYFPKKYNDEQIEIVEKAKRNRKVLVQGPPGTGKSHTIANLICHLLAHGNKVLITAYTKRALEVLKQQLPEEFHDLSVNLLSGDSESLLDLDKSVNSINSQISHNSDLNKLSDEITKNEYELNYIRQTKAETVNKYLSVKEKETRRTALNSKYEGTLSELAERLENEKDTYVWYKDNYDIINQDVIVSDVTNYYDIFEHFKTVDCSQFVYSVPDKSKLISFEELKNGRELINEFKSKYEKQDYTTIESENYDELKRLLDSLLSTFMKMESVSLHFKESLFKDYKTSIISWIEKLNYSSRILEKHNLDSLKEHDRNVLINYPEGKTLYEIKNDAIEILNLLKSGKRITGLFSVFNMPFTSVDIKTKKYFVKSVKVNGSDCDQPEELNKVIYDIELYQDFQELENTWDVKLSTNNKSLRDKAVYFKKLIDDTKLFLDLIDDFYKSIDAISKISSIRFTTINKESISNYLSAVEYNSLIKSLSKFRAIIKECINYLKLDKLHPLCSDVASALNLMDLEKYEYYIKEIDKYEKESNNYYFMVELFKELARKIPGIMTDFATNKFDKANISKLSDAIYYRNACNKLTELTKDRAEELLRNELEDLEKREEKSISLTASKKAWFKVLERLDDNKQLRKHLQAWVLAVKKIGKTGKGKRALKFKREAQHQMEHCKDSVPCWIMPLYKVAETITPQRGMYDYVIIDEASQLGADAIFLLYISKNIIIVGDDKQTSPEYVGVDTDSMTPFINKHLENIPFKNFYGTEFSFFDHAKMFCDGVTVLREHFRCMPEIIEFCDKNFYAPDGKGLYPLKQYSENRLEPLKSVFCENGFTEGTTQNIVNNVEAELISDKIYELSKDERYIDKTIGVIALQGNKQADLIDNLLIKKIGEKEYRKRKIICGNSASFQGDERDVIFLSLITATNHRRSAFVKPEDQRRFNVAVSRAKEQVWLYHSVHLDDLSNSEDLRYKLLDHFVNYKHPILAPNNPIKRVVGNFPAPFESWFEVDVYNDIINKDSKYRIIPQYQVAKGKYRIDLVSVLPNGVKIAIECDGDKFHGIEQFQNDLMRQKVLERCGWQFFRVRGCEYYSNRQKALLPLWDLIEYNSR